ncbi:hypothetical protein HYW41_01970 [Candidatus Daviesbacteria bacterium]|nr:hypothetical protein [Candidatus Daviesbacteria bacterium]
MIDVSSSKKVKGAKYFNSEINQLYHPTGTLDPYTQDIVYSYKNINSTKFSPILIKEWFSIIKEGGYLIIDYYPNKFLTPRKLEEHIWWLWKNQYQIIWHNFIPEKNTRGLNKNNLLNFIKITNKLALQNANLEVLNKSNYGELIRFICKKISHKETHGNINQWSFGIVSNGKREKWVKESIELIRAQKIPNYEIIICGIYKGNIDKDIKFIYFKERNDIGWISKKKNLIVKKAQHENICFLNDRLFLDKNWFKGMKKWGNYFEHLTCPQLYGEERVMDWVDQPLMIPKEEETAKNLLHYFAADSYLDYKDWSPSVTIGAPNNIVKKSIIAKNELWWDESCFYGDREDFYFSTNLNRHGFIERLNPYAILHTRTFKELSPTYVKYDPYSFEQKMIFNNFYAYLKFSTYLLLKILKFFHIKLSIEMMNKTRGEIYALLLRISPSKRADYLEWQKTTLNKGDSSHSKIT